MLRKSKQKQAILKVLRGATTHPTADWVYAQVKQEIPHVSLGTVYRNLKLLKQEGEILEIDLASTISRFDGNTRNHYHFRCEQCGSLFDVNIPVDKEINNRVSQKTGFKVTYHRLEFRGLCKDCQRAKITKGNKTGQEGNS